MGKTQKLLTCLFILIFITTVNAAITMPNGQAPVCIQYDGNFVSNNTKVLTDYDVQEIDNIFDNDLANCLSMDVPMKWVWEEYSGNKSTDFNFDGIDAVVDYVGSKGKYVILQNVVDTTGYYNVGTYTFLDTNFTLTKTKYDINYPNATRNFVTDTNKISMYDEDLNTILWYSSTAVSEHFASNDTVFGYVVNPNEGFSTGLMPQDSADQNTYWQDVYLPSVYADIDALNADWNANGELDANYTDFNEIDIPWTSSYPVIQQYHYWKAKSDKAAELHNLNAGYLKSGNASKKIFSTKILPDYIYPTGTGRTGYTKGLDVNAFITTACDNIDAVSVDLYPNQSDIQLQSLSLDARLALTSAVAEQCNLPIFVAELFPSVSEFVAENDTNYLTQMLLQILTYPKVQGISYFSYDWLGDTTGDGFGDPKLSIKDQDHETVLRELFEDVEAELRSSTRTYTSQVAICDNTNITSAYNFDYWHYNQLFGFLDNYRKWNTAPIKMYINDECDEATEPVLFANQVNIWDNELIDLNTWIADGGILLSGYRAFENNERERSPWGTARAWGDTSSDLLGHVATAMQNNQAFDANIATATNIFTESAGSNLFECGGTDCDYEAGYIKGTGVVESYLSGGDPGIISNNIGDGNSIHFAFNLDETISNNDVEGALNIAFEDLFDYADLTILDTNITNFYLWRNNSIEVLNSFQTTTFDYNTAWTTNRVIIITDDTVTETQFREAELSFTLTQGDSSYIKYYEFPVTVADEYNETLISACSIESTFSYIFLLPTFIVIIVILSFVIKGSNDFGFQNETDINKIVAIVIILSIAILIGLFLISFIASSCALAGV